MSHYNVVAIILVILDLVLVNAERDYDARWERIEGIKGDVETVVDYSQFKITRKGRGYYLNGTLTYTKDMDNSYQIEATTSYSPLGNGKFIRYPFRVPKTPMCDYYNSTYIQFIEPLFRNHTDFPMVPPAGLCPIPKGTFYVKDVEGLHKNLPEHLPKGLWQVDYRVYSDDDFVGGALFLVYVSSKN